MVNQGTQKRHTEVVGFDGDSQNERRLSDRYRSESMGVNRRSVKTSHERRNAHMRCDTQETSVSFGWISRSLAKIIWNSEGSCLIDKLCFEKLISTNSCEIEHLPRYVSSPGIQRAAALETSSVP